MKPASESFQRVRSSLCAARAWAALFGRWMARRPPKTISNITEGLRTFEGEENSAQLSAAAPGGKEEEESLRQSEAQRGQPSAPINDEAIEREIVSVSDESENALSKQTLQELKELGSYMGAEFFSKLLDTFGRDAAEHLAALRAATIGGETEQVREEAHALKGASLTIGALGMAQICLELERFGTAQNLEGAPEELARLEREFDRVKIEIKQESMIP
jgi:histidine phosphotransfer protein HptB